MYDWTILFCAAGFTLACCAAGWLYVTNLKLVDECDHLHNDVKELQGACAEARAAFFRYADIHRAKGTPEGDKKWHTNRDLGDAMNHALRNTRYQELGPLQQTFLNIDRQLRRQRVTHLSGRPFSFDTNNSH